MDVIDIAPMTRLCTHKEMGEMQSTQKGFMGTGSELQVLLFTPMPHTCPQQVGQMDEHGDINDNQKCDRSDDMS